MSGSAVGGGGGVGGPGAGDDPDGMRALQILSTAVRSALEGSAAESKIDPRRPAAFALVEAMAVDPTFSDELAAAALRAVADAAEPLARACLESPRGFLHVMSLMQPLLAGVSESSDTFAAVTHAFEMLGRCMAASDPRVATELMQDLALPALVPLIRSRPSKRLQLLRVLYAFAGSAPRERRAIIRALHEFLSDLGCFLNCLSLLVFIEADLEPVLELYLYYARVGIAAADPALRAASVATLAVIADEYPACVAPFLPRLVSLADETWWELRAQLAVLAASFLARRTSLTVTGGDDSDGDDEAVQLDEWLAAVFAKTGGPSSPLPRRGAAAARDAALTILDHILVPGAGRVHVLRVAVAYAARALATESVLVPRFVECLLSLEPASVARLLGIDPSGAQDSLVMTGYNGGRYQLPVVSESWPQESVTAFAASAFAELEPGSLSVNECQLLVALLRPVDSASGDVDADEHSYGGDEGKDGSAGGDAEPHLQIPAGAEDQLFRPLRLHVSAALARANTCRFALEILRFVSRFGEEGPGALTHESVAHTLAGLEVSSQGDSEAAECLAHVTRVLRKVARDAALADAITSLLSAVAEQAGGIAGSSPLRPLAAELGVA